VVDFLKRFCIPVSSHNHLVEVEGDAESPNEVRKEEVVEHHGGVDTHNRIVEVEGKEEE